MIAAGKYIAKVSDYGVKHTSGGALQVAIRFSFGDDQSLIWNGGFSNDKAIEITLKTLQICGFAGEDYSVIAEGPSSCSLNTEKEVEIVVNHREYEGKMHASVQYVNEVGGGGIKNRLSKAEASQAFAGLNLKGEMARLGIKPKPLAAEMARLGIKPKAEVDTTEIPF